MKTGTDAPVDEGGSPALEHPDVTQQDGGTLLVGGISELQPMVNQSSYFS